MRQIKFRIWISGTRFNYENEWLHLNLKGNVCAPQCCNEDCGPEDNQEDYIVEQFTGIQDEKGNDIYEGDILKIKFKVDNSNIIAKVFYSSEDAAFTLISLDEKSGSFMYEAEFSIYEIIGNIHENPELLENKK